MRKPLYSLGLMLLLFLSVCLIYNSKTTTTISAHIGKEYEAVVRDSTFPIIAKTVIYPSEQPEPDSTWISGPTILKFDDPQYGFTLPPSKLGVVGYNRGEVTTITTSPMLETLPFDQLIPVLHNLQEMLKDSGRVPRDERHTWLNISNEIKKTELQNLLFKHVVVITLLVPYKYGLSLNVKCYARCDERDPKTAKYLIDVSVGMDFHNL